MSNVSITLQNNDEARGIINAIIADNPAAEVNHFPALVKIDCPDRLAINRETVEANIGRDWDVQEIHLSLISLNGNIDEDEDTFVLAWN